MKNYNNYPHPKIEEDKVDVWIPPIFVKLIVLCVFCALLIQSC